VPLVAAKGRVCLAEPISLVERSGDPISDTVRAIARVRLPYSIPRPDSRGPARRAAAAPQRRRRGAPATQV